MPELTKGRIDWIDYAKFIGIFLVALGHTSIPSGLVNFIYAFHMPFFFFVSGYLFDATKFASLSQFVKHRFRQLMVPYFWFSIITYLFWFFVGRKFGRDASEEISPLTPLMGILYGTDKGNYLIHCGSLWFLPCLFVVEVIYFLCYRFNAWLILAVFMLAAFLNNKFNSFLLPFSVNTVFGATCFYLLANRFKPLVERLAECKWYFGLGILVLLLYSSGLAGRADMSSDHYSNFAFFLFNALLGIFLMINGSKMLANLFGTKKTVTFISKNTLIILALHEITGSLLKGALHFGLKLPLESFNGNFGLNLVLTIFTLICLSPVIYVITNYLPFLLGRLRSIRP